MSFGENDVRLTNASRKWRSAKQLFVKMTFRIIYSAKQRFGEMKFRQGNESVKRRFGKMIWPLGPYHRILVYRILVYNRKKVIERTACTRIDPSNEQSSDEDVCERSRVAESKNFEAHFKTCSRFKISFSQLTTYICWWCRNIWMFRRGKKTKQKFIFASMYFQTYKIFNNVSVKGI